MGLERVEEFVDAIEGAWYVEYNKVHTDRFEWYDWEREKKRRKQKNVGDGGVNFWAAR